MTNYSLSSWYIPIEEYDVKDLAKRLGDPWASQIIRIMSGSKSKYRYTVESLAFEVKLRHAVLATADDFHKLNLPFMPKKALATCEGRSWEPHSKDKRGIQLKKGAKASVAIGELLNKKLEPGFDCFTALYVIHLKAILDVIGAARFDRHFTSVELLGKASSTSVKWLKAKERYPDRLPGDWSYFRNPGMGAFSSNPAAQGENVLYCGLSLIKGKPQTGYFGFPGGVKPAPDWISILTALRDKDAKSAPPPYLEAESLRIDFEVLRNLK